MDVLCEALAHSRCSGCSTYPAQHPPHQLTLSLGSDAFLLLAQDRAALPIASSTQAVVHLGPRQPHSLPSLQFPHPTNGSTSSHTADCFGTEEVAARDCVLQAGSYCTESLLSPEIVFPFGLSFASLFLSGIHWHIVENLHSFSGD